MASGDVAASFGFSQVVPSEDYRLGYVRINDAADFAMKYAKKRYSTTAALTGSTGDGIGQMATDTSTGYDYRWSGSAWELWSTRGGVNYTPTYQNFTLGNGTANHYYRVTDGLLFVYANITLGSTSVVGAAPSWSLPAGFTAASAAFALWHGRASNTSTSFVLSGSLAGAGIKPVAQVVSGTYVAATDLAAAVPFTWAATNTLVLIVALRIY